MKKEELKNEGLESVKGGHKWTSSDGSIPNVCPVCTSPYIANYSGNRWICANCGSIIG